MPAQSFTEPRGLGRRIVIYGATGSGKTTLSRRLGEMLGLGVVELDAIRHARGWDSVDWPEMRATIEERLDAYKDGWVCEGNYSAVRDVSLSRADTVVWLRLPLRTSFWRLLKRTTVRGLQRHELYGPGGPRESLLLAFTSPKSILWWSLSHHRAHGRSVVRGLQSIAHHAKVYELRSAGEVEALLAAAEREATSLRYSR